MPYESLIWRTLLEPFSFNPVRGSSVSSVAISCENTQSTNARLRGRKTAKRWSSLRSLVDPRGAITSSPRVIIATTVVEGSASSDRRRPTARDCSPKVYSTMRSEEHTSELQSRGHLVCRLLLENTKD